MKRPNEGDLRMWWIPQVPMKAFYCEVGSVTRGVELMDVLARYDQFQFENNVKPDYSNAGDLEMYEDGIWVAWEADGYDDPREYLDDLIKSPAPSEDGGRQ